MDSLILAINVVTPLFLLMTIGYILNRIKMVNENSLSVMNRLVFKLFLPTLMFYNVYRTDIKSAIQPGFIAFCVVAVLVMALILIAVIPLLEKDNRKRGVIIQGIFRSNFVLFGVPVATAILGENNLGITSVLIAIIVPMYNALAVVILEMYRGGNFTKEKIFTIIKGILTNPLVFSSVIGIAFLYFGVKMPKPIETTVSDIGRVATPLALIVLGATFKFSRISGNLVPLIITVAGKLIITPLVIIGVAVKIGFDAAAIVTLISMTASPTAVSSYTMAEEMGSDGELAGQVVVLTTAVSVVTVFLFVVVLSYLGLI
ncbi:MAG: AEC family transporter [Eubacteriales bacterium]|nr:AEC family transporter [Eubacteriales bacterium]